ncbi:MAG: folate-binding protein [Pseudomonadota bacterium]
MRMLAAVDPGRAVLRVGGTDAAAFLQDLVTNDLGRMSEEAALYSALLTPQGKFLFDFLLFTERAPAAPDASTDDDLPGGASGEAGAEPAILIDVAASRAQALVQRLTMYRLRRNVSIALTELSTLLIWPDPGFAASQPAEGAVPDPGTRAPDGQFDAPAAGALRDPRHAGLGWRLLTDTPADALARLDAAAGDLASYEALRIGLGVPATGAELRADETFILEAGFERFHGVDFKKGCYVGQEVTARMKHKAELRKGLARVALSGDAPPGTPVTAGERPAGTLFSVSGTIGLAHLRFDRANGPLQAGAAELRLIERL